MQAVSVRLSLPTSLWTTTTESACAVGVAGSKTCFANHSTNFTIRLVVYRNAKLFPVGRTDHDVITDIITFAIGHYYY